MGNAEVFHPTTRTGKFLLFMWDMIDISENMERAEKAIKSVPNGIPSIMSALAFFALTLVFGTLAWYFDIQSTIKGLDSITQLVVPSLPKQTENVTAWFIVAFTLAPTLLEIFTAGFAKANIRIVQVAIIGFTLFDAITDIPRAYALALQMWPQIELMGFGLSFITYWLYFLLWLFFATLGFELMFIIFGYATICFAVKIVKGEGSIKMSNFRRSSSSSKSDDKIVILDS